MRRNGTLVATLCVVALFGLLVTTIRGQEGSQTFANGVVVDNRYGFLEFWNQHDGPRLLGAPLTGVSFEANVPVQYFERARLEQRNGIVLPGALGLERARWRTFAAPSKLDPRAGETISATTGYAMSGAFRTFWQEHDGALMFGQPISEAMWEQVDNATVRVQYFERARLEHYPSLGSGRDIVISRLGHEVALVKSLITPDQNPAVNVAAVLSVDEPVAAFGFLNPTPTPIPPTATPIPPTATPEPTAAPQKVKPTTAALPKPTPKPAAAGGRGKVIDVDLSRQWLVAMENGVVVFDAPVATGKDGFNTPTGTYPIYAKTPSQTMRGEANGETWVVPKVPNVMYINGGVALHGAYWHNYFGSGVRLSHGCINLPLASAAWLYQWAPVGTKVVVHY